MAVPHEESLARAVDEVLQPVYWREVRRVRRHRLRDGVGRLALLLATVAMLAVLTSPQALIPMMLFFGVLGSMCVFGPDSGTAASVRLNRTRVAGA